ncbi:MAG: RluA family pseudouridine synthase [Finegoldia magna]|nr:RluA family pseudouridine synthase [Finegoldia magna]
MDEVKEFLVLEEEEEVRLDIYLAEQLGDMSRSYIQKIIKDGKVKVNNKVEKARYLVKEEDNIVIEIPEPKVLEVLPQDIPIDIVYEDDDVLIINKPQDMVVHPAPGNYENTLVNGILYHCKDKLSSINGVIRPGIVHRIDKDTSGLLMIAKNNYAHNFLAEQLKEHTITREYEFICYGVVKEDKITVDKPIGRNPKDRLKMAVVKDGKNAITHFEVVERFDKFTHMRARLETGRTHQIRVHMNYIHHPILGDKLYGLKKEKILFDSQVLHAYNLQFIHPQTHEKINVIGKLKPDFMTAIEKTKLDYTKIPSKL